MDEENQLGAWGRCKPGRSPLWKFGFFEWLQQVYNSIKQRAIWKLRLKKKSWPFVYYVSIHLDDSLDDDLDNEYILKIKLAVFTEESY